MNSLRTYLDIVTESNIFENPYQGADAEKFASLTPADQAFLTKGGGAPDINDEIMMSRAPNKGQPVATAAPVAAPTAVPAAPLNTPSASADAAGTAGEQPAQAAVAPPAQPAQTAPKNRDTMSFGQAFADARQGGEKTFTWKGKPYTTDIAKPNTTTPTNQNQNIAAAPSAVPPAATFGQAAQPAATPSQSAAPAGQAASALPPELSAVTDKKQPYWVNGTRYTWQGPFRGKPARWTITAKPGDRIGLPATRQKISANYTGPDREFGKQQSAQPAQQESVGYKEDQSLISIVHLAGLR